MADPFLFSEIQNDRGPAPPRPVLSGASETLDQVFVFFVRSDPELCHFFAFKRPQGAIIHIDSDREYRSRRMDAFEMKTRMVRIV